MLMRTDCAKDAGSGVLITGPRLAILYTCSGQWPVSELFRCSDRVFDLFFGTCESYHKQQTDRWVASDNPGPTKCTELFTLWEGKV